MDRACQRVFNASHVFWKALPIFKIKWLWQTFCVFHSYMRWVFLFAARTLDQRHILSRIPLLGKYHGDNWTSTEQSFENYKSVKQMKFLRFYTFFLLMCILIFCLVFDKASHEITFHLTYFTWLFLRRQPKFNLRLIRTTCPKCTFKY